MDGSREGETCLIWTAPKRRGSTRRSAVQRAADGRWVLLGFVLGVTTNLRSISLVSHPSARCCSASFGCRFCSTSVHLAFGVAGVRLARTMSEAHRLLGGCVLAVLFVYGMIVPQGQRRTLSPFASPQTPATTPSLASLNQWVGGFDPSRCTK